MKKLIYVSAVTYSAEASVQKWKESGHVELIWPQSPAYHLFIIVSAFGVSGEKDFLCRPRKKDESHLPVRADQHLKQKIA